MSIEVRNVSKTFGSFVALRDVTLTIPHGELVALLGPSGSGKTTLLRIIAGLEQADPGPGSVLFHDEDVGGQPVGARGVGFVFQHYALFRHMTVLENVAFGLRARPRRKRPPKAEIRRRVLELLRLVQLEGLAGRYPDQLSGGQRQRVALARALAVEPRVLLLDEPFGALDAQVRQELRRWLRKLHDEIHVTSVFVTHDQEEALEVADRIVVMNRGQIEQIGTPEQVFHDPKTEFVMRFLGQVNRLECRCAAGRLWVGDCDLGAAPEGAESADVAVYVRPHELDLTLDGPDAAGLEACILRVFAAGSTSKVELRTRHGAIIWADVPHETLQRLGAAEGDHVRCRPRTLRAFGQGPSRLAAPQLDGAVLA